MHLNHLLDMIGTRISQYSWP